MHKNQTKRKLGVIPCFNNCNKCRLRKKQLTVILKALTYITIYSMAFGFQSQSLITPVSLKNV